MGRRVDLDDLIDSATVAEFVGLSSRRAVTTYRTRHDDFPQPVRTSEGGRCLLWLRQDVEAWAQTAGKG